MELVPAGPSEHGHDWQLVLRTRRHLVVYDPESREMMLRSSESPGLEWDASPTLRPMPHAVEAGASYACPVCFRPWGEPRAERDHAMMFGHGSPVQDSSWFVEEADEEAVHTAPNYFRLLSESANTTADVSLESTQAPIDMPGVSRLSADATNPGYYERFFHELARLGRGSRGTVFLCQHILNGHPLGRYAVKKIPVGDYRYVACLTQRESAALAERSAPDGVAAPPQRDPLQACVYVALLTQGSKWRSSVRFRQAFLHCMC